MDNYSLADLAAVSGGENGFGGNGSLLVLIVLFLLFGQNGFGNNNGLGSNAATAAAQQEILYGQQFQNIGAKLNNISDGICDSTYAINNSISNEGRALQSQIAKCCCDNQLAIKDLGHQIEAGNSAILTAFKDSKIDSLQAQVNELQLKDAMCGVVRYPQGMTYATNCNPFCGCGGYQQNI